MISAGIELIVFENRERTDLDGVLSDCKEAGYDSVETGVLFDIYSPERMKESLAKYSLQYAAPHGGFDNFRDEKYADKVIDNTLKAGANFLICSGVGKGEGLDGYREAVLVFNNVGRKCREAGLTFCYHNHASEFELIDGVKGIDVLGKDTDPELVKFNVDVGWVHIGGESPSEFIERYKDRVGFYHFKDAILKGEEIIWAELGKGDVPLKEAYETAMKYGPTHIIYEQDRTQIDIKQAITESREYLKKLGMMYRG